MKTINIPNISSPYDYEVCKCGYDAYPGAEFYYKSKYSKDTIIGIVKKVGAAHITSINNVMYSKNEIEIKPKHVIRDEKLDLLFK